MKKLSAICQKLTNERATVLADMKRMEDQCGDMKANHEGQLRLIQNMNGHAKNHAALLTQGAETANVESARNERIAK